MSKARNKGRKFGFSPIGGVPMHPVVHITPDHPEFEAVAATVKPIELVHDRSTKPKVFIGAEEYRRCGNLLRCRRSSDKI